MTGQRNPRLDGSKPLFTIVMAVLNGADALPASIESVDGQTFRDFEFILLDGGSTDETVSVIEKNQHRVHYWRSEADTGIYDAWNKAVRMARGEWISFLGAGDVYCRDALQQYAQAISRIRGSSIQYLSSRVKLLSGDKVVRTIGAAWQWPAFSRRMTVAHVGSMHHRSLFSEHGRFDESYRICGDYELLLRPRERLRAAFVDCVTAAMALGGTSNSNVRSALAEQERAKRTTGGRNAWLCTLEHRKALFTNACRSLVWY